MHLYIHQKGRRNKIVKLKYIELTNVNIQIEKVKKLHVHYKIALYDRYIIQYYRYTHEIRTHSNDWIFSFLKFKEYITNIISN